MRSFMICSLLCIRVIQSARTRWAGRVLSVGKMSNLYGGLNGTLEEIARKI